MRLFIAVDLGEELLAKLERETASLRRRAPQAKWVRTEATHLTLAFLGEVDEGRVPELSRALGEVASRHAPFTLRVRGGGAFGNPKKPRVLWLGLRGDEAALSALQADLQDALEPLGFPPEEREFKPHLTVARAREAGGEPTFARLAAELERMDLGETRVERVALFQSQLTPQGAHYTVLAASPLTASSQGKGE
ncbi:MAG: RNA 2',3'-cyclic phosphodiesterase [Myxococcales bacterium]|nr:RNA 2',3'-cyclic phosphodiesterase [Myxococcales bacterium]